MGSLWAGLIIGFSVAAPVGPIGLLCIQRTLMRGRLHGFVSGLGAAAADTLYGCIAGFGLSVLSQFLLGEQAWIRLVGGLLLIYLGIKSLWGKPAEHAAVVKKEGEGLGWSFLSTFLLTVSNPMTILFFLSVFSAVGGKGTTGHLLDSLLIVLGVLLGSGAWWLLLSQGVGFVRRAMSPNIIRMIQIGSGLMIVGFGLYGVFTSGLL